MNPKDVTDFLATLLEAGAVSAEGFELWAWSFEPMLEL